MSGRLFHTKGAAYVKALVPKVLVFVFGKRSKLELEDLRFRVGSYFSIKPTKYSGACFLKTFESK